jgi:hypothetical protein
MVIRCCTSEPHSEWCRPSVALIHANYAFSTRRAYRGGGQVNVFRYENRWHKFHESWYEIVVGDPPKVLLAEPPKILLSNFLQPVVATWRTYESLRLEHQQCRFRNEGFTNPVRQVARATKLCVVAPNVCGSSVWRFMLPTWRLEFLGCPQIFGKFVHPCNKSSNR